LKKSLWIFTFLILFSLGFSPQQSRIITGKVTSGDVGKEMPGVNVLVKGTKNGTVTDAKGRYSITMSAHGGTLIFSFIGYESKEIKIGSSNLADVVLSPDVKPLEEIVVTGDSAPGRRDKRSLGASVP